MIRNCHSRKTLLELLCCKKWQKKSQPRNWFGTLEALKDTKLIKGVTHAHLGPICYHSETSDVPYLSNQFLGWDFFVVSYIKPALMRLAVALHSLKIIKQTYLSSSMPGGNKVLAVTALDKLFS